MTVPAPMRLRSLVIAALVGVALGAAGAAVGAAGALEADALADPPRGGFAPDPPALASRKQWTLALAARGGKVSVERATSVTLDKPAETPRVIGRFALELYVGRELLDRVRFNVPLMGGEGSAGNKNRLHRPRFEENVTARLTARLADNPRASYLLLVDRETGDTQKLDWPPDGDGHLVPWKTGLSEAGPGDFAEGGVTAYRGERRDGGATDADAGDAGAGDATRD